MQFVRNLLGQQRKRAVASIMSAIENPDLTDAQLRTAVMGALNQYHDTTLDILKSSVNDGTQVNEQALALIARVSQHLNRSS